MREKILIVENEKPWQELLSTMLRSYYDLHIVDSRDQVVEKLRNEDIRLAIVNINLLETSPGMPNDQLGLDVLDLIYTEYSSLPRVVLTGDIQNIDTPFSRYSPLGVKEVLFKGQINNRERLLNVVKRYISPTPISNPENYANGNVFVGPNGNINAYSGQEIRRVFDDDIEEKGRFITSNKNRLDVFVLMPFAEKYTTFYEQVIKTTIENMNLLCKRADDFFGPRRIMKDIYRCIEDSKFILADFSGRNPNVFFEVGISHALGKNVLQLTRTLADVPPKLQSTRCHIYSDTVSGAEKLRPVLESAIREMEDTNYPPPFARKDYRIISRSCFALLPNNDIGQQTYNDLIDPVMKETECKCVKSEQIFNSVSVLDEIWDRLNTAELVIADITGPDADVFYLTGLACGLGKKIIYLTQSHEEVPFDLKEGSRLIYSLKSYKEAKEAQKALAQIVNELLLH